MGNQLQNQEYVRLISQDETIDLLRRMIQLKTVNEPGRRKAASRNAGR